MYVYRNNDEQLLNWDDHNYNKLYRQVDNHTRGITPNVYWSYETFLQNSDGVTPCGALNTDGVENFLPISRYISQTIQNIAIVTMEGE